MQSPTRSTTGEQRITRDELQTVIRDAAQLYAVEARDSEERLSEAEVLRIAEELGLPARHVRRALYELPAGRDRTSILDRIFGGRTVTATRPVANEPGLTLQRIAEYLGTEEYFQPRRRQPGEVELAPADDFVSGLARRLRRPPGRFRLAHADRVRVAARPLEPGRTHVRVDLTYGRRRRRLTLAGLGFGSLAGVFLGSGAAALVEGVAPGALGAIGEVAAFAAGAGASIAAAMAAASVRFRRGGAAARLEADGLLDRLERGEPLSPPSAPWLRRLKLRLWGRRRLRG